METKTKTTLIGISIGILAYMIVKKITKSNSDAFSYIDGEVYNDDGDFYGADGNFYDADGTFLGADGTFKSADGDFYNADGYYESADDDFYNADGNYENASGKIKKAKQSAMLMSKQKKVKIDKSKTASRGRSLAITKKKLDALQARKEKIIAKNKNVRNRRVEPMSRVTEMRRVVPINRTPKTLSDIDKKIRRASFHIAKYTGHLG